MIRFSRKPALKYKIIDIDLLKCRELILWQPDWDNGFIKIMRKEQAKTLTMISSRVLDDKTSQHGFRMEPIGWNDPGLNFLENIPKDLLEGLNYNIDYSVDLSKLSGFKNLRFLMVPYKYKNLPDLTQFRKLEFLSIRYKKSVQSVLNCSWLKRLSLDSYPFEDLTPLSKLTSLETLHISGRKIKRLKGIENLTSLTKLDMNYCTGLENVFGLESCPTLKTVILFRCGKIKGIEKYGDLIDTWKGMN